MIKRVFKLSLIPSILTVPIAFYYSEDLEEVILYAIISYLVAFVLILIISLLRLRGIKRKSNKFFPFPQYLTQEKIIPTSLDGSTLYLTTIEWLHDIQATIDFVDKNYGKIIGNITNVYDSCVYYSWYEVQIGEHNKVNVYICFSMKFDIKDNKTRMRISPAYTKQLNATKKIDIKTKGLPKTLGNAEIQVEKILEIENNLLDNCEHYIKNYSDNF